MTKTYLPTNAINSNYQYYIESNNAILVHTNENCDPHNDGDTDLCTCFLIYPNLDYLQSDNFSCSRSYETPLPPTQFTDDYWYRLDIAQVLLIFTIIFLFGVFMPYKIISRIFGRWLKV